MTSLALCVLPYIWGLYPTLISVPSVPAGVRSPDVGVTVNSGSELGAKNASNGRACLKQRTNIIQSYIRDHFTHNIKSLTDITSQSGSPLFRQVNVELLKIFLNFKFYWTREGQNIHVIVAIMAFQFSDAPPFWIRWREMVQNSCAREILKVIIFTICCPVKFEI